MAVDQQQKPPVVFGSTRRRSSGGGFGASRRRKTADVSPEVERSVLADAGSAAMTGLHTVGSILSTPSRALYGTLNALSGHKDGFGNLNPLDSTGGIELSKFLENQGLMQANDASKWEVNDFLRPVLDMAGDPTSYLGFGALTHTGKAAKAAGTLTKGVSRQISKGERALLGVQLPFSARSTGVLGTGKGAASVVDTASKIGSKIADVRLPGTQVQPLRWLGSKFTPSFRGYQSSEMQALAPHRFTKETDAYRDVSGVLQDVAAGWDKAGLTSEKQQKIMRMALEMSPAMRQLEELPSGKIAETLMRADDPGILNALDPTGGLSKLHGAMNSRMNAVRDMGGKIGPYRDNVAGINPFAENAAANQVTFNRHPHASKGDRLVYVDPQKLDIAWQKDSLHLPAGVEDTPGKRAGVEAFLKTGSPVEASRINLNPKSGKVTFTDGRHRFAVLRDRGDKRVGVMVGKHHAAEVERLFGAGAMSAPPSAVMASRDAVAHAADFAGIPYTNKDILKAAANTREAIQSVPVTRKYVPQYMQPSVAQSLDVANRGPLLNNDSRMVLSLGERNPLFKGMRGGEVLREKILTDPDVDKAVLHAASTLGPDDHEVAVANVAKVLRDKYGTYIEPMFKDPLHGYAERDRVHALAEYLIKNPEVRAQGLFGNDMMGNIWRAKDNLVAAEHDIGSVHDALAKHMMPGAAVNRANAAEGQVKTVSDLFRDLNLDQKRAAEHLAGRTGQTAEDVLSSVIPKHLADDLLHQSAHAASFSERNVGRNAYQRMTSLFKAYTLSTPRRIIRDAVSGAMRNAERGWLTPKAFSDSFNLWHGRDLRGYAEAPMVQDWLKRQKLPATDGNATLALRSLLGSYLARKPAAFSEVADVGSHSGGLGQLLGTLPGHMPSDPVSNVVQGAKDVFKGLRKPFDIPGVRNVAEAKPGVIKVGQAASEFSDFQNRATAFLEQVRQGARDPKQVMRDIDFAHVNYDPRHLAPGDKTLRQFMPFYRFASAQLPYTLRELALNPGGRMASIIKGADRQTQGDPSLPDAALGGTTIPLGVGEDGTKGYLTGLGLMHEQSGNLLGKAAAGDLQGLGYAGLGMLNPLIKGPAEGITGQSFYREGEPLGDLDPLTGRIASNVLEQTGLRQEGQGPVYYPGMGWVDAAVANSPASVWASQLRQATDTRRSIPEKAAVLTTGLRTYQQSPESGRKVLKKRLDKLAAKEGARVGQHGPFATPEALARNPRLGEITAVLKKLEREAAAAKRARAAHR